MTLVRFKVNKDGFLPTKADPQAAGMDIKAKADGILLPGERKVVGTGVYVAVDQGFEVQVRPRSGLALKHGITLANSPGTIDSNYRGEIGLILINHGELPFHWLRGDRLAQLVVARLEPIDVIQVEELDDTDRGANGYGSTGR